MDFQAITTAQATSKSPITRANETQPAEDSSTESGTLAGATNQSEQFNTFINLLTAQVKNQDPLAPLDSTQFVEQLATFTNLELQAEGNKTLEEILVLIAAQEQRAQEQGLGDGTVQDPATQDPATQDQAAVADDSESVA